MPKSSKMEAKRAPKINQKPKKHDRKNDEKIEKIGPPRVPTGQAENGKRVS